MNSITSQKLQWVRADDGIIGGVCLQLARQISADPWVVRLIWLAASVFLGIGFGVYLLCLLALPRTDKLEKAYDKKILGVCARLARRGNVEVGLVRLMALMVLVSTAGLALIAYFLLHLVLPQNTSGEPGPTRSLF